MRIKNYYLRHGVKNAQMFAKCARRRSVRFNPCNDAGTMKPETDGIRAYEDGTT